MNFRIIETFKEMFSEPRLNGVMFLWILPTLICVITHCNTPHCLEGTLVISTVLFLICFLMVRFTLD